MAKKKDELYWTPAADEANKGWKHLVEYCLDQYEAAKRSEYRDKKIGEIENAVEVYSQDKKNTSELWENEANYTVPLTTISCDNLEPRLVSGLVGKKPFIQFEPPNGQKQDQPTEILQEWFNQELEDVVNIEEMARAITHRFLQEGTVYILPYYDILERRQIEFIFEEDLERIINDDPVTADMVSEGLRSGAYDWHNGLLMDLEKAEPVEREILDPVFEGGKYKLIPFEDVYIADDVDEWEDACVIRKVRPTYAELMNDAAKKAGYTNVGPWLYDVQGDTRIAEEDLTATQDYESVKEHGKKTITCIECSLSYIYRDDDAEDGKDTTDFREERLIAQIALDSKILIRLIPLRKINHRNEHLIKRLRLFPERGKSYGTSMAQKLSAIQEGASKTFNTAINIAEVTLIPWFLFTDQTGLGKRYQDGLKLAPGKGIQVDTVDGLYFPKFSINPDQMFNWINLWVGFWERVSSIGDLQVGRQGEENRTATETMAVIQEGNIKHNYQVTTVREDFLSILRTMYDLYYQHMPFDKTFFWNGQDVPIPRALMRRRKKFMLTGSTELSNKMIERREKVDFYQMSIQDPNINPLKRSEELVKAYGHTDTSEWISPNIGPIVEQINAMGASDAVGQFLQQMAAQMEQQPQMEQADQIHQQKLQHKDAEFKQKMEQDAAKHQFDMQSDVQDHGQEMEQSAQKHSLDMAAGAEKTKRAKEQAKK